MPTFKRADQEQIEKAKDLLEGAPAAELGFVKSLFFGRVKLDKLFPYPAQNAEEAQRTDELIENLEVDAKAVLELLRQEILDVVLDVVDRRLDWVEKIFQRLRDLAHHVGERLQATAQKTELGGQSHHWQQMLVDERVEGRTVAVGIIQFGNQHVEDTHVILGF